MSRPAAPFARTAVALTCVALWAPCGVGPRPAAALAQTPPARTSAETGPGVAWDQSTLTLVAAGGYYGRVVQLRSGRFVAGFSQRGRVMASTSADARTWSAPVEVAAFAHGEATNSELLELADGRVLYLFNERDARPGRAEGDASQDNGIAVAFSEDGGRTWGAPRRLYGGGPMWEPAGLQEDDGDILVFFADEKPYPRSHEQRISVLRSRDGGATWTPRARAASFRAGHRDGMPAPLKTRDGRLLAAIEDNGLHGKFKPVIVNLTDRQAWPIGGASDRRWGALATPLPAPTYAGAPDLVQLDGGTLALSAQVDSGDGVRRMVVWTADETGRNFARGSSPFAMAAPDAEQLWNGLYVRDGDTLGAVAGTTVDGVRGLWIVEGRITAPGAASRGRDPLPVSPPGR
ncbi:sialidase family protein [Alienimonas sp. DA493]|uniref:sialidase family protein n=1 Tax=Alienimonas sp. DA493 TaxID=3373605 RepID=UPI00375530B4